jgi:hypothetical protein
VLSGSHAIFIGAVHSACAGDSGSRIYTRRNYGKFAAL